MPKQYDRDRIETLLFAATEKQREYWDALSDLEHALDCEVEGETIGDCDVDSLIALAEGEDSGDEES